MVLVMDTSVRSGLVGAILDRLLVVAMPMEELEVHQPVVPTQDFRDNMVGFQLVFFGEKQSTECTPPLLQLEQMPHFTARQRVFFQSLRPVDQVAIEGAGVSPHFYMPLDNRCGVFLKDASVLGFEPPAFALVHCPVSVSYPPIWPSCSDVGVVPILAIGRIARCRISRTCL